MDFIKTCHISALLHDIGKFIERGKINEYKEKAENIIFV
jgi:HD superfamily phosphodiesterase